MKYVIANKTYTLTKMNEITEYAYEFPNMSL